MNSFEKFKNEKKCQHKKPLESNQPSTIWGSFFFLDQKVPPISFLIAI